MTAAVQRFVEDGSFDRLGGVTSTPLLDAEPPMGGDNPLLGLRKGDGLDTIKQRPKVKIFQSKLNEVMDAPPLKVDGQWGDKTQLYFEGLTDGVQQPRSDFVGNPVGDALFQGLPGIEALLKSIQPIDPNGIVPPNPEVERIANDIAIQYTRMLVRRSQALTQLERDLQTTEEAQPTLGESVILGAGSAMIDGLDSVAGGKLRGVATAVAAVGGQGSKKVADSIFNDVFSEAKKGLKSQVSPTQGTAPLFEFINKQRDAMDNAMFNAQANFLNNQKPQLQEMTPDEKQAFLSNPAGGDPRVPKANSVLDGMRTATDQGFDKQYNESAMAWSLANARQTLGTTGTSFTTPDGVIHSVEDTFIFGLLEHRKIGSVPGILEIKIEFDPDNVSVPVRPTKVAMAGLSPVVRARLSAAAPTIGDLTVPKRARGSTGIVDAFNFGTNVVVAKSEHGALFDTESDKEGRKYYRDKGAGDGFAGIAKIFSEIDATSLAAVGGIQRP